MASGGNDEFRLVGRVIDDKFRVERVLGEGGYGVVYAGTHLVLGLPVAIKCLKPFGFTAEERAHGAEAFLREARILFTLGHPSIVRLYDVGIIDEGKIPYCVLELLTGTTLAEEISTRRRARHHFDAVELVGIVAPILEAVGFAHGHGVVHRDLKPGNIMLVEDAGRLVPKVLDFGTARDAGSTGRAAATGDLTGKTGFTPLYAAPEQWDGKFGRTGPHTDVFALGLTIAEMCVLDYALGVPANVMGLYMAALDDTKRPSVRAARKDLPEELDRVLQRALKANVNERYPDARELLSSFRTAMKAETSTAPLARPLSRSSSPGAPPGHSPSNPGHSPSQTGHLAPPQYISAPPHSPSRPHSGPPAYAATPYASTTQPQAITIQGGLGPPIGPPRKPRSNPLPWILGILGVILALLGAFAVGLVFAIKKISEAASQVSPVTTTAPPAAPGAPPPARTTAAPAAAPQPAPPPVATVVLPPGAKVPTLLLQNALDPTPMWTKAEALDVANSHHAGMTNCVRTAFATDPKINGSIDIIISPEEDGTVENAMCNMRNHRNTNGESVMCACIQNEMVRWKFPPAHGRIGLLKTKSFIYEYKLLSP